MTDAWQARAACATAPIDFVEIKTLYDDPQQRFPNPKAREARRICALCPVLIDCQRFVLHNDVEGFAGGMTPHERRQWKKTYAKRRIMKPAA